MEQPPKGWHTDVKIEKVTDSDTLDIVIERRLTIRLEDFDGPETYRPQNESEREHGTDATNYVKELVQNSKEQSVFIKSSEMGKIRDIASIGGRVEGTIFIDGKDLRDLLIESGYKKRESYE